MFVFVIELYLEGFIVPTITESCTDGNVSLFNGKSELEGILHICVNSVWITVCYNQWIKENNNVICRQSDAEYNGTY